MLVNTLITAAFKDSFGRYISKRLTIFEFTNISLCFKNIECSKINNKEIRMSIECPICGEYHNYIYNLDDFIKRSMIIGGCEKLGLPIFFIGNSKKVEDKVNRYKEITREIYAMI